MSTDSAAAHAGAGTPRDDTSELVAASAGTTPPGTGRIDTDQSQAGPTVGTSPRASDAERADAVARLHEALGAGRLDLTETDERVTSAYGARYRHELAALLADLPRDDTSFTEAPTWAALWMLAVWRARTAVTGTAGPRPTASQQRAAILLTVAALVWMAGCAVVGALVVGA
jgi:Domain of unknown function (DUF1707)